MLRALEACKHDLAVSVKQVYQDALLDSMLRILQEAILIQTATLRQSEDFQDSRKFAKAKIKQMKSPRRRQKMSRASTPMSRTTSRTANPLSRAKSTFSKTRKRLGLASRKRRTSKRTNRCPVACRRTTGRSRRGKTISCPSVAIHLRFQRL
jgi:hypothetical protein